MARVFFRTLFFAFLITSFFGCSRKSETARITIQLPPAHNKSVNFSSFAGENLEDPWLGSISTYEEINCYIVVAGGSEPEMSRHYCLEKNTEQTLTKFGVFNGGIPAGSTVEIEVPAGKNRNIILLGAHAQDGACVSFHGTGPQEDKITHPRVLASKTINLETGSNPTLKLEVPADLRPLYEVGKCYIDEPWADEVDSTPTAANLVLADVTGNKDAMNISSGVSPGPVNIFSVTNTGTANSSDLASAVGLTNSTHFTIGVNGCTGVLAPGASCSISVRPLAVTNTSYSGVLSLSVDNLPSLSLSGTASGFVGPAAVITGGQPATLNNDASYTIQVGGTNVTHYKYKLGTFGSVNCATVAGYSAEIAVGTDIVESPADGNYQLCLIGRDGDMNWQPEASATSYTWTRDTAGPSVTVSSSADPGPTATDPIPVNITFSEDVSGFSAVHINATNGAVSNFTTIDPSNYTVDIIPDAPGVTVTASVSAGQVQDAAGNSNAVSNAWSISYDPDVTLDAMDWADFYNESSELSFEGLDVPVDIEISASYGVGTPTLEYNLNGGGWNIFDPMSPANEVVYNGMTLKFRISGTLADSADIQVYNFTDSNALIDTTTGTVEDPCNLAPVIGDLCYGGSVYAGTFNAEEYMVMPSGCADSGSPSCSGTDSVSKGWNGSGGTNADVTGLADVIGVADVDPSDGDINTPVIVADPSVALSSAAEYCDSLTFGGYADWFLPSKSELAYLYCKSSVVAHNSSYPQEDPDCASVGGKSAQLGGFATGTWYWSSSEASTVTGWRINFDDGSQSVAAKSSGYKVRCMRKK